MGTASPIRFERITKAYSRSSRPALDEVDLDIDAGRFVVVLGGSGSGKTTLLKLVNRLIEPTRGRVLIDGIPVGALPAHLMRRRIGYVIQQIGLFPHMRVEGNVAVVPRLLGWQAERIDRRTDELLELVGLPPDQYRRRYPAQLSGGEQQRVGLARALAAEPTILLMDEPFGALDAVTRSRLQGELLRIHRRLGQTVLFVTHNVEEALRLADRIVVLRDGRAVQHGTPAEIVLNPADPFVGGLVGSEDPLRRLGLVPVGAALRSENGAADLATCPSVPIAGNLRGALALLLESRAPSLRVLDADERLLGIVDLESIRAAVAPTASTEPGETAGCPS